MKEIDRRQFITRSLTVCGAAALVSAMQGCSNFKSLQATESNGKLAIKKADMGEDKFIVVRSERTQAPLYLAKTGDNAYTALLMLCTHKQCELRPTGTFLTCPCHGSEFSNTGKVLKEPADKDLYKYNVTSDETSIYIHLK